MTYPRSERPITGRPSKPFGATSTESDSNHPLDLDPHLLRPPILIQTVENSPILQTWGTTGAEVLGRLASGTPPEGQRWVLGLIGSAWCDGAGWLCQIAWPTHSGPTFRSILILGDRDVPSAGQILRLAPPWSDVVHLIAPMPAIASIRIPSVSSLWVGAALDSALFVALDEVPMRVDS
jgi:hypothetical protein